MIVAIDGPAGSGKSTTARRVAERMGWLYLDTGAMYRAVALAFLESGTPFTTEAAAHLLDELRLDLTPAAPGVRVKLNGEDVTDRLRTPDVSDASSRVSVLPLVRERLVAEQRRIAGERQAAGEGVVIEGRDIGTVVFPNAEVKVFLVADARERARRRRAELAAAGEAPPLADVAAEINMRDRRDLQRELAPLRRADDAVELDTTGLDVDEQVDAVIGMVRSAQEVT